MPYIQRNNSGRILALYAQPSYAQQEFLASNEPEIQAFLTQEHSPIDGSQGERLDLMDELTRSDMESIRIIDDLVEVLVNNSTIRLSDLPSAARAKLLSRKQARDTLSDFPDLLEDDEPLV